MVNARVRLLLVLTAIVFGTTSCYWTTYGFNNERNGDNPLERTISPANVGRLHQHWATNLGGVSDTSPVVAPNVSIGAKKHNVAYVGTESGQFVAVDTANGSVLWTRFLGHETSACQDFPNGVAGVTGAAALDLGHSIVYVAGGDGKIHALNTATGADAAGWPVTITTDPLHEHEWGGLTFNNGRLYYTLAGVCDEPPYHGRLGLLDVASRRITSLFYPAGATGPVGGGIWGWGGASVDPVNGNLYITTGNASITGPLEGFGFAESVVELSPTLRVLGSFKPQLLSGFDRDFGSTPTVFDAGRCRLIAAENKDGELFTFRRDDVAAGPIDRYHIAGGHFIGEPGFSPETQTMYITNPGAFGFFVAGLIAARFDASCHLHVVWETPAGRSNPFSIDSTPSIANGVVYFTDGLGSRVYGVDALNGRMLWNSGTAISGAATAAPTIVDGQLLVAARDGKLHAFGL